jgi:hypothetical protein
MHSLCSSYEKTSLTPPMTGLPQSVEKFKPGGVPIASLSLYMNHIQFLLVSESMTPIATGYIQLCPSTAQAINN